MFGGVDAARRALPVLLTVVIVVSVLSVSNVAVGSSQTHAHVNGGASDVRAGSAMSDEQIRSVTNRTDLRSSSGNHSDSGRFPFDRSRSVRHTGSPVEEQNQTRNRSLVERQRPDEIRQGEAAPAPSRNHPGRRSEAIQFRAGAYTPEPGVEKDLVATTDVNTREQVWVVVQFTGDPDVEQLREHGYEFGGVLSDRAQFAGIPAENISTVGGLSFVRSVTSIRPAWRLDPGLAQSLKGGDNQTVNVTVATFEPIDRPGLSRVDDGLYRGQLDADAVQQLTKINHVKWVQRYRPPKPTVSEGRKLVSADRVDSTFDGTGVSVAVVDSGIDHDHPHFIGVSITDAQDWVDGDTYPEDPGDSHGVHVAGTITGQGTTDTGTVTGVAPGADLVISRVFDAQGDWHGGSYSDIFDDVNSRGAQIISNSWGHDSNEAYDARARIVDRWARNNPETLLVFANGNYPDTDDMQSPALAKNVIAVGAVKDGSDQTRSVDSKSVGKTAAVSDLNNLDPPEDGRVKPDVNAPGENITGPVVGGGYAEYVGTSMATPHVSGVAAMYKHAYGDVRSSRVKASFIATADPVRNPDDYPVGRSGIINAHNAIYNNEYEATQRSIYGSISEGNSNVFNFSVPQDAEKVVVTLTWLDPPGETNTINSLVNKLDLYAGPIDDNERYFDLAVEDNVAKLVIEDPESGEWNAKVYGFEVSGFFTTQSYDGTIRVVTDEPAVSASTSDVRINLTETGTGIVSLFGEGAPASGTYVRVATPSAVDLVTGTLNDGTVCSDAPYVVGGLSEGFADTSNLCFQSDEFGTHSVSIEVHATNAPTTTEEITVEIAPDPICEGCDIPNDPDDDGVYEDVNGDSEVTFLDAYRLYQETLTEDPSLAFDVNGDDEVTFLDAYRLYQETLS